MNRQFYSAKRWVISDDFCLAVENADYKNGYKFFLPVHPHCGTLTRQSLPLRRQSLFPSPWNLGESCNLLWPMENQQKLGNDLEAGACSLAILGNLKPLWKWTQASLPSEGRSCGWEWRSSTDQSVLHTWTNPRGHELNLAPSRWITQLSPGQVKKAIWEFFAWFLQLFCRFESFKKWSQTYLQCIL